MRAPAGVTDDRGSNPVEFLLVGTLLTALTLAVLQLAFAIYVRNVVHDAAVEGAYYAALADTTAAEGEERAREVIRRAVGPSYADDITVASARRGGQDRRGPDPDDAPGVRPRRRSCGPAGGGSRTGGVVRCAMMRGRARWSSSPSG